MSVLDELVVLLSLNAKPFKEGSKEVQSELDKTGASAEKNRKKIEDEQKKVADAYGKVRDSILSITAAVVGAVAGGELLSFLTKNDAAVGRLSKNLGMATEELSLWEGIFSRMGSSSGDADNMFKGINKILEDIKNTGGSEALTPLARVGLDIGKFANASTTASERVKMLSDALKKLTPQDAQYFSQQAGLSESATNVLIQQRYALEDLVKEQQKMNVVSEQDKKLAQDREKAWGDFTQTLEGLSRKIVNQISPALTMLLTSAQSFIQYIASDVPTATSIFLALGGAVSVLMGLKIATWASTFSGALGTMGGAAGTLLGRLGMITAALASLYEVIHLIDAVSQYVGISNRSGVKLSSDAQARINAGEGGSNSDFKSSGGATRGMRNNNPGNLEFRGQAGAKPENGSGRFAAFSTMAEGVAALDEQLMRYAKRGKDTIRSIISTYAPAGENNTDAYIAAMVKTLGVGADDHLNLNDKNTMRGLLTGITAHENGAGKIGLDDINAGLELAQNRGGSTGGGTSVTTGDIHVHTSAATMSGVGQDAGKAIRNQILVSQANYGVR